MMIDKHFPRLGVSDLEVGLLFRVAERFWGINNPTRKEVIKVSLNAVGDALPAIEITPENMIPQAAELHIISESAGVDLIVAAGECLVVDESIEEGNGHPLRQMVTTNICI